VAFEPGLPRADDRRRLELERQDIFGQRDIHIARSLDQPGASQAIIGGVGRTGSCQRQDRQVLQPGMIGCDGQGVLRRVERTTWPASASVLASPSIQELMFPPAIGRR